MKVRNLYMIKSKIMIKTGSPTVCYMYVVKFVDFLNQYQAELKQEHVHPVLG